MAVTVYQVHLVTPMYRYLKPVVDEILDAISASDGYVVVHPCQWTSPSPRSTAANTSRHGHHPGPRPARWCPDDQSAHPPARMGGRSGRQRPRPLRGCRRRDGGIAEASRQRPPHRLGPHETILAPQRLRLPGGGVQSAALRQFPAQSSATRLAFCPRPDRGCRCHRPAAPHRDGGRHQSLRRSPAGCGAPTGSAAGGGPSRPSPRLHTHNVRPCLEPVGHRRRDLCRRHRPLCVGCC